jgi:hypothetical protein
LVPISHWLKSQWQYGENELATVLSTDDRVPELKDWYIRQYRNAASEWAAALGPGDHGAHRLVSLLFSSITDADYPKKLQEPQLWPEEASLGVTRMISAYSLGRIATLTVGPTRPDISPAHHALLGETIAISYLWGASRVSVQTLITRYQNLAQQYGHGDYLFDQTLLVLINPRDRLGEDSIAKAIKALKTDIVDTAAPQNIGQHLRQDGEVLGGPPPVLNIKCLYAADLEGALTEPGVMQATERLRGSGSRCVDV